MTNASLNKGFVSVGKQQQTMENFFYFFKSEYDYNQCTQPVMLRKYSVLFLSWSNSKNGVGVESKPTSH